MKDLLKYLGVVLIIIAVAILAISLISNVTTNTLLFISLVLLVGGLLTEIIVGRLLF